MTYAEFLKINHMRNTERNRALWNTAIRAAITEVKAVIDLHWREYFEMPSDITIADALEGLLIDA